MLLYEAGGKFEKHQDSEKEDGMFGTLVVVLPGRFEGGELLVHDPSTASSTDSAMDGTKTSVWDPAAADPFELKYVAFYGDCPHEVKPVAKGHRLCLTYNLVKVGESGGSEPRFGGNHPRYAALKNALCDYFAAERVSDPKRQRLADNSGSYEFDIANPETHRDAQLVYVLDHKYTRAGLSFQYLKNKDALVADCFTRFCAESNGAFELYLCKLRFESEWRGNVLSEYKKSSRGDPSLRLNAPWVKHGAGGSGNERIVHIAGPTGTLYGKLTTEAAPAGVLERGDLEFDAENKQAYTGNEGAGVDKLYETAALVLFPLTTALQLHHSATPKTALKHWATIAETNPRAALAVVSVFRHKLEKGRFPLRAGDKALEAAGKLGSLRAVESVLTSLRAIDFQTKLRAIVVPFEIEEVLAMAKSIYDAWVKDRDVVYDAWARDQGITPDLVKENCISLVASLLNGVKDPSTIKKFFDVIPIQAYSMESAKKYLSTPDCLEAYIEEYARVLRLAVRVSIEQAKKLIYTTPIEFFVYVAAPAVSRVAAVHAAKNADRTRATVSFTIEQLTTNEAAIKGVALKNQNVDCGCRASCLYCRKINEFLASNHQLVTLTKHTVGKRFDSIPELLIKVEPSPSEPKEMLVTKALFFTAEKHLAVLQTQLAQLTPTN